MPTSNEDLNAKAEEVQSLREQVRQAESDRRTREAEVANDVTMAQLQAEEAALRARLAVIQQAADTPEAVADQTPLAVVREQMEAAVERQKAAEDAANESQPTDDENEGR